MPAKPPALQFTLDELAQLVGLPRRTIRYYIQIGLVDRPIGETRAAHYTQVHVEQLLTVARYSAAGLSLEKIGELLREPAAPPVAVPRAGTIEVRSHLLVADGIELVIEPARAGLTPGQVRHLFREVRALHQRIAGGKDAGADR